MPITMLLTQLYQIWYLTWYLYKVIC